MSYAVKSLSVKVFPYSYVNNNHKQQQTLSLCNILQVGREQVESNLKKYCIVRKFGEGFNLPIWRFQIRLPN